MAHRATIRPRGTVLFHGGRGWTDQFNYLNEGLHECDWGGMNNGYDAMECNDEKEVVSINLCEFFI